MGWRYRQLKLGGFEPLTRFSAILHASRTECPGRKYDTIRLPWKTSQTTVGLEVGTPEKSSKLIS